MLFEQNQLILSAFLKVEKNGSKRPGTERVKSYINTHDCLPPSASISLLALIYLYIFFIARILLSYRMINGDNVMKSTNLPPDEEAVWWWWQRSVQKDMGATMEP